MQGMLRIEVSGGTNGQEMIIYDADTGDRLDHVRKLSLYMEAGKVNTAYLTIAVDAVEVEVAALAKVISFVSGGVRCYP